MRAGLPGLLGGLELDNVGEVPAGRERRIMSFIANRDGDSDAADENLRII
jgi:hypothetical protein